MSTVSSVELEGIVRGLARDRLDDYASRALARAYEEFVGRRRKGIASLALETHGRSYRSFYDLLADPAASFSSGRVQLLRSPDAGTDWEFLAPFETIAFHDDGSADLHPPGGAAPRRAIARVLLREHYLLRSRAEEAPDAPEAAQRRLPSLVGTIDQGIAVCRRGPVVPFEVALLVYLAEERVRYEVDLVHSALLGDPRAGRLAASRRVRRSSRIAWGLDRKLGRGHLSLLATRCLEVLAESNGMSSIDLTHIFGGVREIVESALQALVQQRYASFDPRTGIYRARLDAFLPPSHPPAPAAVVPVRPELRTGVQELIAAADARATCPLCGKPLPGGPRTLLCDECTAKVGIG